MSDRPLFTDEAALAAANVIALSLADSGAVPAEVGKVRLFTSALVPDVNTVKADLVAAETTLVGYPAGGYSIADMGPAIFAPGGGAVTQSPLINVVYASGAAQLIGGWWQEDSAGDVRQVFIFDPPRSLANVGDGFPIVTQFGEGRNA